MLALRTKMGLTQVELAQLLGVSRRAVGAWESGSSYPKIEQLKKLVALAIEQHVFSTGHEVEEVRALWQASHQRVHWMKHGSMSCWSPVQNRPLLLLTRSVKNPRWSCTTCPMPQHPLSIEPGKLPKSPSA